MSEVTYPPEFLPVPEEDDDVEIVVDGVVYSPEAAANRFLGTSNMSDWQPIETAPRDGTSILVASRSGQRVREAFWQEDWYGDETKPGWMIANCDEEYGSYVDATHWMPLPPAPTPQEGE